MTEGGALITLIKQHKLFELQAVKTLVVYREHKIRFRHKNKGIQYTHPVQTIYTYKFKSLHL